ncbi:MAG TPA: hydantoinase/oxoprolinase family protein [Thermoleophilaceae bacterium]|nr:hydantoinase/oxoprolinase family protein [Thermoleophilaceae bacterium]
MIRIGVDTGGTFTDVALMHDERVHVAKVLTTPEDPSIGVLAGTQEALTAAGIELADVDQLVHGTTLASNVVLERKGRGIALVTTDGFRDVLLIGRQKRYDIYDLQIQKPPPLIRRRDIVEVRERMRADGSVETPLDNEGMRALARLLAERGVMSVAVCFLNSYANAEHELEAREILAEEAPELMVSLSAEVAPQWREYERTSTTVVNAYVAPTMRAYLSRLQEGFRERGLARDYLVMQSNGGTAAADTARRFPVRLIESGPAAGVIMAGRVGKQRGEHHVVSFDMGGTTAKLSHVDSGTPRIADAFEVDRVGLKPRSGLPISIPAVDLVEIGAGGGSIARISSMGLVAVGPDSAGSAPGPICYGRGGTEPTVTDADLVLGYLDAGFFAGGSMALDVDGARAGIQQRLAEPLGIDVAEAAWAVHELVNTNMIAAARTTSVERGVDPRQAALVATGGAGPVHAARLARGLGIARTIVPVSAGVASAFGLLAGDVKFDTVRTRRLPVGAGIASAANELYAELQEFVVGMARDAVGADRADTCTFTRSADARYVGQGYEVRVPLPDRPLGDDDAALLAASFRDSYEALYGRSDGAEHVEVVNWRLEARVPTGALPSQSLDGNGVDAAKAPRDAYFPEAGGYVECPVYDRYRLAVGDAIGGPALIEERESTTVVLPEQVAEVDEQGNLVLAQRDGR